MDYDEALTFIREYLYGEPCDDRGYLEMLDLTGDLQAGDRVLQDTRILRAKDYLQAQSVIRRWENQQEKGSVGQPKNPENARAEGYALGVLQTMLLEGDPEASRNSAADKTYKAFKKNGKERVKYDSVRRYLQGKDRNTVP